MFDSISKVTEELRRYSYVADQGLATSLFLAIRMGKPLFLEGEPGVGKTELAKVLSRALATPLIRLQCYEGLSLQQAVYDWNYPRQLLEIQAAQGGERAGTGDAGKGVDDLFVEKYLLRRPLLQAIDASHEQPPVLLIDEIDRADDEFESFLLELLADFQITIPEIGTIEARHKPITLLTSNRTREVHDALKRRCVYHWIEYPSREKEIDIVRRKVPGISERLSARVVTFVQQLRRQDLYKVPGVSETLDWAEALGHLGTTELNVGVIEATLGMLLKYQDDVDKLRGSLTESLVGLEEDQAA